MKKSSFVATMLGTFSGMLFALGMCMALISEWNPVYNVTSSLTENDFLRKE